jgi:hypothetical protein
VTHAQFKELHESLTGDWGNMSIAWLARLEQHEKARAQLGLTATVDWEQWIRKTYQLTGPPLNLKEPEPDQP